MYQRRDRQTEAWPLRVPVQFPPAMRNDLLRAPSARWSRALPVRLDPGPGATSALTTCVRRPPAGRQATAAPPRVRHRDPRRIGRGSGPSRAVALGAAGADRGAATRRTWGERRLQGRSSGPAGTNADNATELPAGIARFCPTCARRGIGGARSALVREPARRTLTRARPYWRRGMVTPGYRFYSILGC
jgi:hypothetical protein